MTARRFAHATVDASWRLDHSTYERIRDHVLPSAAELRWCDLPWRDSLVAALDDARDVDMPILLWAMDGHPFGSTCSNGIIARRLVWADPDVRALAARFVPAADDAGSLRRGTARGASAFREIVEQGHFAGRREPTDTRQGIYAATPSGTLLASVTSNNPRRIAAALRRALARWESLPPEARVGMPLPADAAAISGADADSAGDLVLQVFSRDLPRAATAPIPPATDDGPRADGFADAASPRSWNLDVARFTAAEARGLVPAPSLAARRDVPTALALRIARHHLLDNVRGQTVPFEATAVAAASLESEVTAVDGDTVTLRLGGAMRASVQGRWPIRGVEDRDVPGEQERGFDMTLLGHATFDVALGRFRSFELVAAGLRWGATQYNERADDRAPAPMGIVLILAPEAQRGVPALQRFANVAARS